MDIYIYLLKNSKVFFVEIGNLPKMSTFVLRFKTD